MTQIPPDPNDQRLFRGDVEEPPVAEDSTDSAESKGGPIDEQAPSDPKDGKKMGGAKGTGG